MNNTLVDKIDQFDPVESILEEDIHESDRNCQSTDPTMDGALDMHSD
jgi:hypothetical protein